MDLIGILPLGNRYYRPRPKYFGVSMAVGAGEPSSSNSSFNSTPRWKYHIFLSFRGDTRKNFTDYLYATLRAKRIVTFRDDEQLEKGGDISEQLLKSIEESLSAIVVLSQQYASSAWCLDELHKILESRKVLGREVFPVFCDVDPSDVRDQKGSFGKAFEKHERRYKEDRIKRWRDALTEVSNLPGWHTKDRNHSEVIEELLAALWPKLKAKLPSFNDGLVGIDSKMKDMLSLLARESEDVHFIGIWGMGGIGKTTLARVVFERIRNEFELSCFLSNVREVSEKGSDGLVQLQRELLSHLTIGGLEIKDSYEGKKTIKHLLSNKKVLLVLDDVSAISQLESLAGNHEWFDRGSRVIITTRDRHLLTSHGVSKLYEIQILNNYESLRLFCQKAFKEKPGQYYLELSKKVVQYAGGLPLALKVLGCFLCGRSAPEWENALNKMRKVQHKDILSILQISYEALDDTEKHIFLNIACFFKGMEKDEVTHILKICDLYPIIGINVLLEKCLLTEYYEYDKWLLGMHDMLQEMGKNIVIHDSNNDVGKRSRLWLQEDIDHVLTKNKGTEVIHGIVLDSRRPYKTHWDPMAFSKMCNLKLLILRYLDLPRGLYCLPEGLKYLEWENFPLEELPLGLELDELVELTMHHSNIKQLWNGTKFFRKLKLIDLKDSTHLIRFPSVSGVPCLTRLVLEECVNLVEVDQSVGLHKKLRILNLTDCVNLKILPRKLEMDSLKELILSGCSKIKKLPEFGDNMEMLTELNLKGCKSLVCLPKSIHNLKSLRILNTSNCFKFSMLPEDLDKNKALEELNVSGTAVREVPTSIAHLKYLKKLSFGACREMESNLSLPFRWKFWKQPVSKAKMLPPVSSFPLLQELCLSYCNLSDESLPLDIGCLSSLAKLDLSGNNFCSIPASCIANLSKLYYLKLDCCPQLQSVPMLPPSVERLYGRNSASWKPFSDPLDLCDYLSSHIQMKSGNDPFLMIPGSEIPPLFSNQNYFKLNIHSPFLWEVIFRIDFVSRMISPSACNSLMSIMIDIPHYCISSQWWGIAVCLVLENPFPASSWFSAPLYWICKAPGAEFPLPSGNIHVGRIEEFSDPHLCILLLRGDDRNIQRHLRGNHGQLQLLFYAEANAHEDDEADDPGMLNISKCGCCVLCKEDLEVWGNAMSERKQSDNFELSSNSLYKSRVTEIVDENACCDGFEGEYATASTSSNAEAKRRRVG